MEGERDGGGDREMERDREKERESVLSVEITH